MLDKACGDAFQAEAWRDATTLKECNTLYAKHGVCWSELWRLPYWDPSRMLVIDSMHCILEGLVHYHYQEIIEIDADKGKSTDKTDKPAIAFSFQWPLYEPNRTPLSVQLEKEKEKEQLKQLTVLHRLLETALNCEGGITHEALEKGLHSRTRPVLVHLCWSLSISPQPDTGTRQYGKLIKADFVRNCLHG
ncbi:hypothetical protein K438DRAFT_1579520 [Mycena galopus ATCC 62051]|nr:hypothetical protein K438DRAFT_1579520 [Mycena galopus ATCC 62051]